MKKSPIDTLFAWVIRNRNLIVRLFWVVYALLVLTLFIGGWSTYMQDAMSGFWYQTGDKWGEMAIVLLTLISLPGIFRRFGRSYKLISIIMMFRRQLGITMYLFVLLHLSLVRVLPTIIGIFPLFPIPTFELFGVLSATILFFLFITSNDVSVSKLGDWWGKIHRLLYIILWLVFLHTALYRVNTWSMLIGFTAVVEVASFVVSKKRQMLTST